MFVCMYACILHFVVVFQILSYNYLFFKLCVSFLEWCFTACMSFKLTFWPNWLPCKQEISPHTSFMCVIRVELLSRSTSKQAYRRKHEILPHTGSVQLRVSQTENLLKGDKIALVIFVSKSDICTCHLNWIVDKINRHASNGYTTPHSCGLCLSVFCDT